ncbi:MAG TPA: ParB/RepB/Spo0J family partition protein [Opitutaceae bacterium]|nr:ParB/RepB/Spo0J family partition protein [Opitutaceae bacterium]
MAAPKTRLGRGLAALIASGAAPVPPSAAPTAPARADTPAAPGFQELGVDLVERSPFQPRKAISEEQLAELAESIRAEGLLQPIVVRRAGDRYQLIAGERRWRAFQLLKLKTIPARVLEASDASSATLTLIENLQREGLNPIEEAYGYASLIRDFDLTQEQAAERVGKGRATVANSLRLLSLAPEIQGYLAKGLLSVGHAKVLLGVEEAARRAVLARRVIEQGLSVRVLEGLAQGHRLSRSGRASGRAVPAAEAATLADLEKRLTTHLGARVRLQHSPKRGRLVIEYAGNSDLQRILEKIGLPG